MATTNTFDFVWEQRYLTNPTYRSQYPWTAVVSFVLGHAPKDRPRSEYQRSRDWLRDWQQSLVRRSRGLSGEWH